MRSQRTAAISAHLCLVLMGLGVSRPDTLGAQRSATAFDRASTVQRAPAPPSLFRSECSAECLPGQTATRGSGFRIVAQIAGSMLAAGVVGFTAWQALDDPQGADRRVKGDDGYTPNANTAYAIGSFVGSTVVAYVIGRGDGSRGSLVATALGAAVPTIPLALGRHQPYLPLIGLVFGAPAQGIGATLGYQLTRRAP